MNYKSPVSLIQGLNQKFSRESKLKPMPVYTAYELSILMSQKLKDFDKTEYKTMKEKVRSIEVEGWKGSDELIFEEIDEGWKITEHRKDKLSGEVATSTHKIPEKNVTELWEIIKSVCKTTGTSTKYRKLVPSVIEHYHFPIELEEFNGGKNRARYYFPYYYFCVKILEHLGFIRYGGRGKILRLK